jgi:hypothetical protein
MSIRLWAACGAAATVLAIPLSSVGVAYASHGGQANAGTPDNKNHYIDRNALTTKTNTATIHGIDQLNRTVMNATLTGSGDVEVYDGYYGTGGEWSNTFATTYCAGYTQFYQHCDVYSIQYNLTYMANWAQSEASATGCHELGHTAGLGHRTATTDTDDNSCLRSGRYISGSFDAHDVNAINEQF